MDTEYEKLVARALEAKKAARAAQDERKSKLQTADEKIRMRKLRRYVASLESEIGPAQVARPAPVPVKETSDLGGAE